MTITRTVIYDSIDQMQHGVASNERRGWQVASTTDLDRGWSCLKTCCLGWLFFPLALVGKKTNKYQVTFKHE